MRIHISILALLATLASAASAGAQDSSVVRLRPFDASESYPYIEAVAFAGADSRMPYRVGDAPFVRWRLLVVRLEIEPTLVLERFVSSRAATLTRLDAWELPLGEFARGLRLDSDLTDVSRVEVRGPSGFALTLDDVPLTISVRPDTTAVVIRRRATPH